MRTFVSILTLLLVMNVSSCASRIVTRPASVTVIKTPPRQYKIVTVKGHRYYLWNGKHYKKTRRGYVFVKV
ncbi:MAG: hypothetical protein KJN66_06970 [Bacteroidia bacterium]|nr:hypothetical protein [Bacteroidia bacterium]